MFPMLFKSKIARVIDVDKFDNAENVEAPVPLEKGDKAAIAIAAVIVYLPVLLIMCGVIYGLTLLFTR